MLDKNKTGLILGVFFAIVHAVWALAVAAIPVTLQNFLDWIFKVHFLQSVWILTSFNFLDAVMLVVITFVCGFVFGWVFAWVWNMIHKK